MKGRVAAVDLGRRRVGLAVCDPLRIAVRGLPTLALRPGDDPVDATAAALRDLGVVRVVVGLPLHADGRESQGSRRARAFAEALARALAVPVEGFDEGLTSWEAERALADRGADLRRARREGEVDRGAAVAILRSWLADQEARGTSPPPPPA